MRLHDIRHTWPHNWYGFWRWEGHDYEELPFLTSAVDPLWEPEDKDRLVSYLEQSPIVVTSSPSSRCLLCPSEVPTLCYQSDGAWLWPKSLAHYVREHSIVLPERFVQHIRDWNYEAPREEEMPVISLRDRPWPETWAAMWRRQSWTG
jgi:hypothetical protein